MTVWARTWQLFLRIIVVLIIFVNSIAVAIKFLSHWEMDSLPAKGWVLFVCVRGRSIDFLRMIVNDPFDVLLLDPLTGDSEWKASRCLAEPVCLIIKVLGTSVIGVRAWQCSVFLACIVVLEAGLMRTETIRSWVVEALDSGEIARLVERRWFDALSVRFDGWESWTLCKTVSCLRWWVG